jgi:asparagine synthase (glutamine-hydrolysing)
VCGITGVFGGGNSLVHARRMNDCLAHRGPDDHGVAALRDASGVYVGAIAQRRLAIIDLSPAGHQPMVSANGRYSVVFNGEIYNYRELRRQLEHDGARFVTSSDTEVLLAGVALHGHEFVGRLRGMFAFVLWDRDRARALLARDPFGIKPLWMVEQAGVLAVASEIRALLVGGFVRPALSSDALAGYLAWGSPPEPQGMVDGVVAVPAGSVLEVSVSGGIPSSPREVAHFSPFDKLPNAAMPIAAVRDPAHGAEIILDALRDSVAHHLIADVPVALFLSGGIDSSVISALATEVSDRTLDSFTVVFNESEFSEATQARIAAHRFETRHHEIPLSGEDFFAALPSAFRAMDQPSMDGLNTFVVSKAVRDAGIKVVLSGLGGDELFAGYPSFARAQRLRRWWPVLRALRTPGRAAFSRAGIHGAKLAAMLRERSPARAAYVASRMLFPRDMIHALTGRDVVRHEEREPPELSLLQQVSWYELTGYMRNVLLRDSDIFAMAHALELRVPFVDRGVVAASLSVADSLKLQTGVTKALLVHALGDRLPREVWDRPKRGFALPFAEWMRGPLRDEVGSALTSPSRLERVGIRPDAAGAVWRAFLSERGVTWSRPWALYTLVRWAEELGAGVGAEATVRGATAASALAS